MVKILLLGILYASLTLGNAYRYRSISTTLSPTIDPLNPSDVTSILQRTIAQILNDYRASYQEWKHNEVLINAIKEQISTTFSDQLQSKNFSLDLGKISIKRVEQTQDYDTRRREIGCLFGDNLKFQMPITGFRFEGNFNVTSNNSSTPLSYEYEVILKGLYFSLVLHSNLTITENDIPSNLMEIDISYKRINIDLDTPENDEQLAAVAEINTLLNSLKSSLRNTISKQITSLLRERKSLSTIYSYCMQPKKLLEAASPTFAAAEYQHYYLVNEPSTESWDTVNLKCTPIKLRGLWNFDSLSIKGVDYEDVTYTMKFDNLEGEVNCSYSIDDKSSTKPQEIKFKIEALTLSGSMNRNGGAIINMNANFEPLLEDAESSDPWASLSKIMVLGRIKKVIENSLTTSLMSKYRYL